MADSPKARLSRIWIGCSLAALALAAGAASAWWYFVWDDDPVPGMERMLDGQGPPVGATRKGVEEWLEGRGMTVLHGDNVWVSGMYPEQQSPAEFSRLDRRVTGEYVSGRIDVRHRYGWARVVCLYFFFDADGRLIQHIVKAWDGYL